MTKKIGDPDMTSTLEGMERLLSEKQELARKLSESEKQKAAITEVLRAISQRPGDVEGILEIVAENAAQLCEAADAVILQVAEDQLHLVAKSGASPMFPLGTKVPITNDIVTGRAVLERTSIHVPDLLASESDFPRGADTAKKYGTRTVFATPMMRGENAVGVILVRRFEMLPFTDSQIGLLKTFADQAAILIENVRLLNEVQEKSNLLSLQAIELEELNRSLEGRIARQVSQIEYLGRLEHELVLAREIQISMLPRSIPKLMGYNFGARMVPARFIGGDFFDFILFSDASMGIAVGDVSEKGIAAALFMAMVRSLLRAEAHPELPPDEVLRRVNHHLISMNDKDMFVTMIYGVIDRNSHLFRYSRAGHPPPIVQSEAGIVRNLGDHGSVLGVFEDAILEEQVIKLSAEGVLLLYSDGISDSINPNGDFFGDDRICRILSESRQMSAQATCDAIIKQATLHQGPSEQNDDMTALIVQVTTKEYREDAVPAGRTKEELK